MHTVKNSIEFVKKIEPVRIDQYESQVFFDVVSLFTSALLKAARTIVFDRLSNDSTFEDRTTLSIVEITEAPVSLFKLILLRIRQYDLQTSFWHSYGFTFISNNC